MKEFSGFLRANEEVGIRNHVLVLSVTGLGNPLAKRIAQFIKGTVPVYTPNGRGQVGKDKEQLERTLVGLAGNPNVAATLVVSYDQQTADYFKEQIEDFGKPVETLSIFKENGTINATAKGMRLLTEMTIKASEAVRTKVPVSKLTLGLECGGSDLSSGKVSNPTVGSLSDTIVSMGGTSIFSETVELIGTEKILASRGKTKQISKEIISIIDSAFNDANDRGADVKSVNPVPENIEGGLQTLEKKALGALMKTGKSDISGVLKYAENPKNPGLYFMDTPFFSTESMTAMSAAGAQIILFTTGVGNNIGDSISPTVKITGNPNTSDLMSEHIDVDISTEVIPSGKSDEQLDYLFNELILMCNGKLTNVEVLEEVDQAISRLEPSV